MIKYASDIVHICSSKGPTSDAQRVLIEMTDLFPTIRHRLICLQGSWLALELKARSIDFLSFKSLWGQSIQVGLQLLRVKTKLIHWHQTPSVWLMLLLRLLGVKQVLSITRKWSSQISFRFLIGIWLADWIVAGNPSIQRSLARRAYCSFKRCTQINSGFDLAPPRPCDLFGSKQEAAQKLGLDPQAFIVAVFIDDSKEKLHAFFKLVESCPQPHIQWVIFTSKFASFKLRYQCKRHRIHLFEKEKDWRLVLKATDVLYLPREPSSKSPFAGLEALALGVRFLSTSEGDMENLIFTGVTGYQLKRDHPEDLYKGLIYLLETPCVNRGRLMKDLLMSRYSTREMIQKLSLVYQELYHANV